MGSEKVILFLLLFCYVTFKCSLRAATDVIVSFESGLDQSAEKGSFDSPKLSNVVEDESQVRRMPVIKENTVTSDGLENKHTDSPASAKGEGSDSSPSEVKGPVDSNGKDRNGNAKPVSQPSPEQIAEDTSERKGPERGIGGNDDVRSGKNINETHESASHNDNVNKQVSSDPSEEQGGLEDISNSIPSENDPKDGPSKEPETSTHGVPENGKQPEIKRGEKSKSPAEGDNIQEQIPVNSQDLTQVPVVESLAVNGKGSDKEGKQETVGKRLPESLPNNGSGDSSDAAAVGQLKEEQGSESHSSDDLEDKESSKNKNGNVNGQSKDQPKEGSDDGKEQANPSDDVKQQELQGSGKNASEQEIGSSGQQSEQLNEETQISKSGTSIQKKPNGGETNNAVPTGDASENGDSVGTTGVDSKGDSDLSEQGRRNNHGGTGQVDRVSQGENGIEKGPGSVDTSEKSVDSLRSELPAEVSSESLPENGNQLKTSGSPKPEGGANQLEVKDPKEVVEFPQNALSSDGQPENEKAQLGTQNLQGTGDNQNLQTSQEAQVKSKASGTDDSRATDKIGGQSNISPAEHSEVPLVEQSTQIQEGSEEGSTDQASGPKTNTVEVPTNPEKRNASDSAGQISTDSNDSSSEGTDAQRQGNDSRENKGSPERADEPRHTTGDVAPQQPSTETKTEQRNENSVRDGRDAPVGRGGEDGSINDVQSDSSTGTENNNNRGRVLLRSDSPNDSNGDLGATSQGRSPNNNSSSDTKVTQSSSGTSQASPKPSTSPRSQTIPGSSNDPASSSPSTTPAQGSGIHNEQPSRDSGNSDTSTPTNNDVHINTNCSGRPSSCSSTTQKLSRLTKLDGSSSNVSGPYASSKMTAANLVVDTQSKGGQDANAHGSTNNNNAEIHAQQSLRSFLSDAKRQYGDRAIYSTISLLSTSAICMISLFLSILLQ